MQINPGQYIHEFASTLLRDKHDVSLETKREILLRVSRIEALAHQIGSCSTQILAREKFNDMLNAERRLLAKVESHQSELATYRMLISENEHARNAEQKRIEDIKEKKRLMQKEFDQLQRTFKELKEQNQQEEQRAEELKASAPPETDQKGAGCTPGDYSCCVCYERVGSASRTFCAWCGYMLCQICLSKCSIEETDVEDESSTFKPSRCPCCRQLNHYPVRSQPGVGVEFGAGSGASRLRGRTQSPLRAYALLALASMSDPAPSAPE